MHQFINPDQILEEYGGTLKMPAKMWPPVDSFTPEQRENVMPVNQPQGVTLETQYLYEPQHNPAKYCKYSRVLHELPRDGKRLLYEDEISLYTIPMESKPHGIEIFDDQLVLEFQTLGRLNSPQVVKEPLEAPQSQKGSMLFPATIESRHETDPYKPLVEQNIRLNIKPEKEVATAQTKETPAPAVLQPKTIPPEEKRSGCCAGGCELI